VAVGRTLARRGGALGLDGWCAMDAHRGCSAYRQRIGITNSAVSR